MSDRVVVYGLILALFTLAGACKTSQGNNDNQKGDQTSEEGAEGEGEPEGEMRTRRFPDPKMTSEKYKGKPQVVAQFTGPMPTGVTVSPDGRIFINFPRWGDEPRATVTEFVDGMPEPYPNAEINELDKSSPKDHLLSVQSVVVGPKGERLWALDTGSPKFGPTIAGGAKLVAFDLETDEVVQTITFPSDVALKKSYLNDVRFDLTRGEAGTAYITDSSGAGDNGIVVVDMKSGESWRRLHRHEAVQAEEKFVPIVEGEPLMQRPEGGEPSHMTVGSDGIALGADGKRLYFRPLSGRGLYSVSAAKLADRDVEDDEVAETLRHHGDLGFASDGLEADASGRIYLTNYEDNAVLRWSPDEGLETLVHSPQALWPDTLALTDGWLYYTANQLHRQAGFHDGEDLREKPYTLFRVKVDAEPVARAE